MATGTNNIAKIWDFYTYINNNGDLDNVKESLSEKYGEFADSAAPASGWGTGLCPSKAEWLNLNSHMKKGDIVVDGAYADNRLVKFTDLAYLPRAAELIISPTTWTSPVAGSSKSISVTYSNADYYNISSDQSWCSVPSGNQTAELINISTSANTTTSQRTATVTFSCVGRNGETATKTHIVTQQGKSTISVNPTSLDFTPAGGEKTSTVDPINLSTYSVASDDTWCTVSKSGNTISVSATVNAGEARNTTIYAHGTGDYDGKNVTATISVSQGSGVSDINLSSNITYEPSAQSDKTASVSRTNLSTYTAGTDVNWINLSQDGDVVTYSVDENASVSRTGTIYVHGVGDYDNIARTASIYIGQKTGIPSITITPSTDWIITSNGSSTKTVSVTYTNATDYSVTASASWVTVSKNENTVTLTAAKNTESDRACTVVFGVTGTYTEGFVSDSIYVSQKGVSNLAISESSWNVPVEGGTKEVTGTPTNLTTYYATSSVDWAQATKSGDTITISATSANGTARTGEVTLYGTGDSDNIYRTATVSLSQPSGKSSISVEPSTKDLTPAAATNTATVTRTYINGYAEISSNVTDWLNCTINGDTITYSTTVNKGAARTGTITIYGTGAYDKTKRTCTLVVSQSLGSSNISISSDAEYTPVAQSNKTALVSKTNIDKYTVKSNQTWCTVPSGDQTGNSITYSLTTNIGAARTATITVTGTGKYTGASHSDSIYVSQSDGSSSLSVNSGYESISFGATATTKYSYITTKNITGVAARPNASWLTSTISGNTVTLKTSSKNTTGNTRNAIVTVTGTGTYDNQSYSDTISVSQSDGTSSISISSDQTYSPDAQTDKSATVKLTNISSYTATSNADWLTISTTGTTSLKYSCSKNETGTRTGTITIAGTGTVDNIKRTSSITITQNSGLPSISVNPTTMSFTKDGSTKTASVSYSNVSSYAVQSNKTWCTVTKSGNTITVVCSKTNSTSSRTATITITGTGTYAGSTTCTITVTQVGAPASISVSPTTWTMSSNAASTKSFGVTLTNASTFDVSSLASWLSVSATASSSVTLKATKNTGDDRSDVVYISTIGDYAGDAKTATITISQEGASSLKVSPLTHTFTPASSSGSSTVTATNMSRWYVASSDNSWLTATKLTSKVNISAAKNTGSQRTGYVYVYGTGDSDNMSVTATITINQSEGTSSLSFNSSSVTLGATASASTTTSITQKNITGILLSDSASWLYTPTISGNTVTLKAISKNTTGNTRNATVTITGTGAYNNTSYSDTITVYQEDGTSGLTLSSNETHTPAAVNGSLTATPTKMGTLRVYSDKTWCTATISGNTVSYSVGANTGAARTATVYVYGTGSIDSVARTASVYISQSEGTSNLSFNSSSATLGATASASTTTSITQKNITGILLSDSASWLYTPTISGNTVTLKAISENTTGATRDAIVTITGTGSYDNASYSDTITVYQEDGTSGLTLSSNKTHTPAAVSGSLTAIPTEMGTLRTKSDKTWCTATISGNTVSYSLGVNTGAARTATVYVYGTGTVDGVERTASVYISQSEGTSSLLFDSSSVTLGATASASTTTSITQKNITGISFNDNASWLNTPTISGNTVTLKTSSKNTTSNTRNATVTITGTGIYDNQSHSDTITVYQEAAVSSLEFTTTDQSISYSTSGNKYAYFTKSNLGTVTATSSDTSWLNIVSVSASSLTYSVTTNSGAARSATITIKGTGAVDGVERTDTITVTQSTGSPDISVNPTSWTAPLDGGAKTASVTCTRCSISDVDSDSSWLTATYSGTTVTLTASKANGTARTAIVTITGAGTYGGTDTCTISVSQAAGTSALSVSPTSMSFDSAGGSKTASIDSTYISNLSVTDNQSWITTTRAGKVSVAQNTGDTRSGTVTITGIGTYDRVTRTETISVSQTAAPPSIKLNSTSISFAAAPTTNYTDVGFVSQRATSISVSSNAAWCTAQQLSDSIRVQVQENTGISSRSATITVTAIGDGGTDTATLTVTQGVGVITYRLVVTPSVAAIDRYSGNHVYYEAIYYTYVNGKPYTNTNVQSSATWHIGSFEAEGGSLVWTPYIDSNGVASEGFAQGNFEDYTANEFGGPTVPVWASYGGINSNEVTLVLTSN